MVSELLSFLRMTFAPKYAQTLLRANVHREEKKERRAERQ